ncbi:unnamed protein product [Bemisia tabaci]|uniref:Galectin domain-containing protein n=1 Tax=Bemisia tabaci TaxID=7038 RepID=A0A9P0A691_BEMTA|nr:unnamed protein product [Bemisia tabaci]
MDFAGVSLFLSLYFYHVVRIGGENTTANTLEATCSGTPAPDAYLLRSWNFKKIFNGKGQCMPIQLSLEYGFSHGSKLLIEGATLEGNWFSIELKSVLLGDIPLHLSGRPYEEKFIKNSKTNSSSWGVEEFEENWPFYCGKKFTLSIECLKESYKMNVNGIQMREFAHRLPHSIIDALRMNGALVISHVQYAVSSIHPDIFWPNSDNSNATTTQITQNQTNGHDSTASPTDLKGPIFNAFDRDKNLGASNSRNDIVLTSSDFLDIQRSSAFIDKTMAIVDFLTKWPKFLVLTAPKRFGKTSLLSMFRYFFGIPIHTATGGENKILKAQTLEIFQSPKLKIWQNFTELEPFLMSHAVVSFNFGTIMTNSYEDFLSSMKMCIFSAYTEHSYLTTGSELSKFEKEENLAVLNNFGIIGSRDIKEQSGQVLVKLVRRHLRKNSMVFIDDYDKPLIDLLFDSHRHMEETFDPIVVFLEKFIAAIAKNGDNARVLLTGTTKFGGTLSSADNLKFDSIFERPYYANHFGFTYSEVEYLAKKFQKGEEHLDDIERWYGGYSCSDGTKIFRPNSVVNYFHDGAVGHYWKLNSSPFSLRKLSNHPTTQVGFKSLLQTGRAFAMAENDLGLRHIVELVSNCSSSDDICDEWVFKYLLDSGVFSRKVPWFPSEWRPEIEIPNWEVEYQLKREILNPCFLQDVYHINEVSLRIFVEAAAELQPDDKETFQKFVNTLHLVLSVPELSNQEVMRNVVVFSILNSDSQSFVYRNVERIENDDVTMAEEEQNRDLIALFVTKNDVAVVLALNYQDSSSLAVLHEILERRYFEKFYDKRVKRPKDLREVHIGIHFSEDRKTSINYITDPRDPNNLRKRSIKLESE